MSYKKLKVGIVMGSKSDWPTMKKSSDILKDFDIAHECEIVSAHRQINYLIMQKQLHKRFKSYYCRSWWRAHLPGMIAANTWLPVLVYL